MPEQVGITSARIHGSCLRPLVDARLSHRVTVKNHTEDIFNRRFRALLKFTRIIDNGRRDFDAVRNIGILEESQGRGSLVGFRLWGRTESDTTEVT